jgi:hypothetical protein
MLLHTDRQPKALGSMDFTSMAILGAFITTMSGVLLIFARFQYRDTGPILWWAAAHFVNGMGTIALAIGLGSQSRGAIAVAAFTCSHSRQLWPGQEQDGFADKRRRSG